GITYLNGVISDGAGSATGNSITKAGAGALVLGTGNTYTGFTNINAGTLVVTGDSNIPAASKVTLGGGALGAWTNSFTTSRDYILTAASTFDVGPSVTLTQAGPSGSNPGSNISGAFALTKAGLGTLTLNGINSMSGVSVNNGILQAAGGANLGDPNAASAITLSGGTFRPTSTFTTNRPLTATNGSVDVPTGVNLTLTGVISGANFIKTGLGTFTNNSGTNTNTVLTVQNGTMLFDGTNTAFAAAATPNINGGTLQFTNTANRTVTTTGIASFGGGGRIGI
ncbi:MAG: autotransporter-associated beta strand repeat-containing protein, partial [Verrucomicrobia bacterium]|nr:autotransporter-associated beta strand repeat-containing protein [Verrucomicrobiota bacterium]